MPPRDLNIVILIRQHNSQFTLWRDSSCFLLAVLCIFYHDTAMLDIFFSVYLLFFLIIDYFIVFTFTPLLTLLTKQTSSLLFLSALLSAF